MSNTKLGNMEAIALIFIIMVAHILINIPNIIILDMKSSSILNTFYISLLALILSYFIYKLMKQFPTFDILDISHYLGGNILKKIVGFLFWTYFIFFSSILLRNILILSHVLYFSDTPIFYINVVFILGAAFSCTQKYNSIFRANLLLMPLLLFAILFIFFSNINNYSYENIFPILGDGPKNIFLYGIKNLFAFQGIGYLYFLPSMLKNPNKLKKIFLISIVLSSLLLILTIATSSLLFSISPDTDELIPLFSAVRYIEFGHFFQRLDPIFLMFGIIAFESYICVVLNISSNILVKITNINKYKQIIYFTSLLLFGGLLAKNYSISTFIIDNIYKYAFFILVIGLGLSILLLAFFKKKFKGEKKYE